MIILINSLNLPTLNKVKLVIIFISLNLLRLEVELTPAPGVVYRTIGGILDMYFFLGPEPEAVIRQYLTAIGRPVMPPYWALGFHLAKYGYNNLETMQAAVNRLRQYDIPHVRIIHSTYCMIRTEYVGLLCLCL